MMTLRQFFLLKLSEECAEISQRALKQIQFGASETQAGQNLPNRQRLSDEINDLLVILQILEDMDEVMLKGGHEFKKFKKEKVAKLEKYLKYSQELGAVGKS